MGSRLHIHLALPVPRRCKPGYVVTSPADHAEFQAEPDPRIQFRAGPVEAWSLPNDLGFAIGRRSFHLFTP